VITRLRYACVADAKENPGSRGLLWVKLPWHRRPVRDPSVRSEKKKVFVLGGGGMLAAVFFYQSPDAALSPLRDVHAA